MSAVPHAEGPGPEELARAIDDAVAAAANLEGTPRRVADALRESIEAAHRAALVTIVRRLRQDEAGRAALYELVDDPLVHMLFSVHGIIRPDPMVTARTALERVRPGLQSHGGDVELVGIDDGVARVRLSGACNGCSMSAVTMRESVERALVDSGAVSSVQVLPAEPAPTVIPLSAVRRREPLDASWVSAAAVAELPDGALTALQLRSAGGRAVDVVVVRLGDALSAFVNECAHQSMPLDDAELDPVTGELTCPWHGFCYDARSGECTSSPGAALEALPLRVEDGSVWIRVGA